MSPGFGKKSSPGKTVAIIDVENGSVGAALARLFPREQPKLFGESRFSVNRMPTANGEALEKEVARTTREALHNTSLVAARLRTHEQTGPIGEVERGIIFLHAPWTGLSFAETGKVSAEAPPEFLDSMRETAREFLGDVPVSFHSFAPSASPILHSIFSAEESSLICTITSEVTELALTTGEGMVGYGTFPIGSHAVLRTLASHGGYSDEEIASLLRLPFEKETVHPHVGEPLDALAKHFVQNFKEVASVLLAQRPFTNVFVIAPEPLGEWFAKALAQDGLEDLFQAGGVVRAVRPGHISRHIAAHTRMPDIPLLLGALFVDSRWGGVY